MNILATVIPVVVAVLLLGLTASLVAASMNKAALVTALAAVLALVSFGVLVVEAQSLAKEARFEMSRPSSADVLWAGGEEGVKTVLLLQWPGSGGPRLFEFPWDSDEAASLRSASTKAKARNRPLRVRDPFGPRGPRTGGEEGDGSGGPGQGRPGRGKGPNTGDNDVDGGRFYSDPPEPMPEKSYGEEG